MNTIFSTSYQGYNKLEVGKTYKFQGQRIRVTKKLGYHEELRRNNAGSMLRHGVYQFTADVL